MNKSRSQEFINQFIYLICDAVRKNKQKTKHNRSYQRDATDSDTVRQSDERFLAMTRM